MFIVQVLSFAMLVIAIVMLTVVSTFSQIVKKTEISNFLKKELLQNRKYVFKINENYVLKKNYYEEDKESYLVIVNKNGKKLSGKYPQDFPNESFPITKKNVYPIKSKNGKTFYVYEQRYGKYENNIYLRVIVEDETISAKYQNLLYVVCISIVITSFIVLILGIKMSKHVSNSLKNIQQTAEQISNNLNMSQRMKYTGNFYELQLLVDTENIMLDKMEEVFSLQEQFVSDVAHELRTPAAVIKAQCEYILPSQKNASELQEAFEVIDRQSKRMNGIIEQLLELSRLEQKNFHLECEKISLVEIIQCICDDIYEKEEYETDFNRQIKIVQTLKEVHIIGNVYLISIAIQNLIENAIKFSNDNGTVEISTKQDEKYVYISVKDNGKGMTEHEKSRIFERFYKSDESRNTKGFGLGLALTKKIAEVHNGSIKVESELGKGSKFILCFLTCE